MAKPEIPLKGGDEYDVHTAWRKVLSRTRHRSNLMIQSAKRSYNKRLRKYVKLELCVVGAGDSN